MLKTIFGLTSTGRYNEHMATIISRIIAPFLLFAVVFGSLNRPAFAQHDQPSPGIIFVVSPLLPDEAREQVFALTHEIQVNLPKKPTGVRVILQTALPYLSPADWLNATPLVVTLDSCPAAGCAMTIRFWVGTPQSRSLLSPNLQTHAQNEFPIALQYGSTPGPDAERIRRLTLALYNTATDNCPAALPLLDDPAPLPSSDTFMLAFFRAVCLHDTQSYGDAIRVLQDNPPPNMKDSLMSSLWAAYLADSFAQNFAFDYALSTDNYNLRVAEHRYNPEDPASNQMMAELYLLRGRHRLYQYEWNVVLEDYNRALQYTHAPARAYYYRGVLYYTQNERQAALEDLTRFLSMNPAVDSPLTALAERYVVELEDLLATPQAQ